MTARPVTRGHSAHLIYRQSKHVSRIVWGTSNIGQFPIWAKMLDSHLWVRLESTSTKDYTARKKCICRPVSPLYRNTLNGSSLVQGQLYDRAIVTNIYSESPAIF